MDQQWWEAARPRFWDREEYPTNNDVLEALELYRELARTAQRNKEWAEAERLLLIADTARLEFERRSETAEWIASEPDPPTSRPFVTPGTVHPSMGRRRGRPHPGTSGPEGR